MPNSIIITALNQLRCFAEVAQLVEHTTENRGVGGSSPPLGTKYILFSMADIKTKKNNASVKDFLNSVEDENKRADGFKLLELFKKATKETPTMWGTSIVGFGQYHYKSVSSEGDWMLVGFSPRKQNLTLYVMHGAETFSDLLLKLGKHKTSGSGMGGCLYINKLADIDLDVLEEIIARAYKDMKEKHS